MLKLSVPKVFPYVPLFPVKGTGKWEGEEGVRKKSPGD